MEIDLILKNLMEYGVLGTLVVILFFSWRSTVNKLIKLIENNTKIVATNTELMRNVIETLKKCEKR